MIDAGKWPVDYTELAENTKWSRSHYQNTVRDYFEPAARGESKTDGGNAMVTISVPEGVDRKSYLKGWIDGMEQ